MRSKSVKMAKRPAPKKGTLGRLLKLLFKQNKALLITVFICLTISAVVSVASSVQNIPAFDHAALFSPITVS